MSFRPWWFPVLLLVAGGIPAAAQTTGQIEGLVRDPDGRVVPGVALRIVESRTEAGRGLESDERGWYLAPGLAPGSYRIELSHPGFRSEKREGVELSAGQQLRVDLRLQLGEARESVSVVAEAQLVSPAPGDWGGSIAGAKLVRWLHGALFALERLVDGPFARSRLHWGCVTSGLFVAAPAPPSSSLRGRSGESPSSAAVTQHAQFGSSPSSSMFSPLSQASAVDGAPRIGAGLAQAMTPVSASSAAATPLTNGAPSQQQSSLPASTRSNQQQPAQPSQLQPPVNMHLYRWVVFRAFTAGGIPLAGGLLYTYAANSTTPLTTWKDALQPKSGWKTCS